MYRDARESSSKRFCKPHRMMLVQGDIKYGPKLPIGKNGARVQTYLSSQSMTIPAYCWLPVSMPVRRKPLLRIRSARQSSDTESLTPVTLITVPSISPGRSGSSLSRLGIRVLHAKPRSGKSKGKIEKFHQVVGHV